MTVRDNRARPSPALDGKPQPFHEVLRDLRKRSGLTQKHIAASLGLPQSVVCDWESGRLRSWRDREPELCELLGLPPFQLSRLAFDPQLDAGQAAPKEAAQEPASIALPEVNELLSAWAKIAPGERRRALAVLKAFAEG